MDVAPLNQAPLSSNPLNAATPRGRIEPRVPFETGAADAGAAAIAAGAAAVPERIDPLDAQDRVERSPELERQVTEFRSDLAQLAGEPRGRIDELRREVAGASRPPREILLQTALSLLDGRPEPDGARA